MTHIREAIGPPVFDKSNNPDEIAELGKRARVAHQRSPQRTCDRPSIRRPRQQSEREVWFAVVRGPSCKDWLVGTSVDRRACSWAADYGEPDLALRLLTGLSNRRAITSALWGPLMRDARALPQFSDLVGIVGLVEYWRADGFSDMCHPIGADVRCN